MCLAVPATCVHFSAEGLCWDTPVRGLPGKVIAGTSVPAPDSSGEHFVLCLKLNTLSTPRASLQLHQTKKPLLSVSNDYLLIPKLRECWNKYIYRNLMRISGQLRCTYT